MTEKDTEATGSGGSGVGIGVQGEPLKSPENRADGVMVEQSTRTVEVKKDNRRHPDPAIGQTVANMVFAGQTAETICRVLKMSMTTLYEHYKDEVETGQASMVSDISTSLAQRAKGGSDTAAIFLLKTRGNGKFTERNAVELTGANGGPIEIAQRTEILTGLAGLLERGITIDMTAEKKEGAEAP